MLLDKRIKKGFRAGGVFLVFIVSACFPGEKILEPRNTVHYYQFSLPNFRATFSDLVDEFHRAHKDIQVVVHTLPPTTDDQHQFYLTHLSTGGESRIDVFALDIIWVAELARAGLLMPVDTLYEFSEWEEFFPASVNASRYNGTRYGVPLFIDSGVLYFRKDLLEKYGYSVPPGTWDELIRIAKDILKKENDPDLQGFVWQAKQYEGLICNFMEFLPQGIRLWDPGSHSLNLNQPAIKDTLRLMRDMIYRHRISSKSVFSMSEEETRHVFQNGGAIFMRNWPYAWRLAQREGSPVAGKISVAPLPSKVEGKPGQGALGGFLMGIAKDTPYPDAARTWVKFLASEPTQKILFEKLGLTPGRRNIFPDLERDGSFPIDTLYQVMEQAVPRPVTPVYMPISQSMQAYISGALAGVYSVEESISRMESDSRRIIKVLR